MFPAPGFAYTQAGCPSIIHVFTESHLNLRQGSSHSQTRIFLFAGFGGLLLLMGILGLSAISSMYQIELREEKIRQDYVVRDRALENLRSNIYIAGTSMRDFLLATSVTWPTCIALNSSTSGNRFRLSSKITRRW
jgi:hypothetical protein